MTDAPGGGPPPAAPARTRTGPPKGPAAFRTISEASAELGVPQHVLRFWETRFAFIRPTKRAGGRRFYRPQDLDVLRGVRVLLQDEGYTIRGVQKLHRDQGLKRLLSASGVGEALASRLAAEAEADPPADDASAEEATVHGSPAPDGEEPDTRDLFAAPPAMASAPSPPSPPAGPADVGATSRSVLDTGARARLSDVLSDLEATKAQIDALLLDEQA